MYIPQPEFYVLYNGKAPCPEEMTIKLSDMFKTLEPLGLPEKSRPVLELEVKVLNINEGKNEAIAQKCCHLAHYSAFIARVREFEKQGSSLEEAVKEAVVYCCEHDIMKELLKNSSSEVFNMLMVEWNWDDALAYRYKEGRDDGRTERAVEIARKMKAGGQSLEEIVKYTGLTLGEVELL